MVIGGQHCYWPMVVRITGILVTEANPLAEMFGHIMINAGLENYASKTVGCSYGTRNSGEKEKDCLLGTI